MSVRETLGRSLAGIIDRRAENRQDVRPRRVVGRSTDGSLRLVGSWTECEERGGLGGQAINQIVHAPRDHNRDYGSAGFASSEGGLDLIWVERQDPRAFVIGATQDVLIIGRGFFEGIPFRYLTMERTPHPGIVIDAAVFVDESQYQLTVTVASDVSATIGWPIAYLEDAE